MNYLGKMKSFFSRLSSSKKSRKLPNKYYLMVLLNSLTVTLLVLGVRQLGGIEPLELKTFD